MKVEIWSDYVCPYCYIGKRRFEAALAQFAHRDQIEVVYKSFELDPNAEVTGNPNIQEVLVRKYGMSMEQVADNIKQVTEMAKAEGLTYYLNNAIQTNTFDAHRLAHFAAVQGKGPEMTERLLKAHFTDRAHLGEQEILADLAAEIGLEREIVIQMLRGDEYVDEVRQDEEEARQIGVRGVPYFVINRKYAISGAQSVEAFLEALQKAWQEEHPITEIGDTSNNIVCTDEGCNAPEDGQKDSK